MSSTSAELKITGFTKLLMAEGGLTDNDIRTHQKLAQQEQIPIITQLVNQRLINSKSLALKASVEFGLPFFDLDAIDWRDLPISLVSESLIRKYRALPLFIRGKTLFVAMSDPTNHLAVEDIKFQSLSRPEIILVEDDKLGKAIESALEGADNVMTELLDEDLGNLNIAGADDEGVADAQALAADEAPVVRFVNKVLLDAIKKGASDIHIEPYEKLFRIRFRQDGILYTVANPPVNIATRIISRIKVMSRLDIAERRVPQDGRIKMIVSKTRAIDFRVSTCPTLFGEKVVLRILDPTVAQMGIEKLGFEPSQMELFLRAINKPYGLILVTGPTGSGKTVTLYTALNILNSIDRNISTAEDPVEITVEGINQVNVNNKAGLTFANALRAFLRQDPDVIMVGEIRDLETADIAVKAAQTGHLVLSTLHTNDAPQSLNRLMQMGVAPFNIVSAINLIMAQRLARRLCENCKEPANYPPNVLLSAGFREEDLPHLVIYHAKGCEQCTNGYRGRVGIYQVLTLSEKISELILAGGNALQLTQLAKAEGINDLRASGLNKVREGITSLEEIDRVTKE